MARPVLILLLAALAACTPRGDIRVAPEAAGVGTIRQVFVGTTRADDLETGDFTGERAERMAFARYDVSVPPDREPGEIRFTRKTATPDPRREFVTVAADRHETEAQFRANLARALAANPRGGREAVIFVHGFNNTFGEGVYRIAQLAHDLQLPGVAVHYSWPSAAQPLGYVYDRDSALFARDGLEQLITEVTAAGAERVLLVAHSMGSALTMETLRTMALRGNRGALSRLGGVILMSPDIDVDVFRAQARAVGKLPQPFLIFGSQRDRVLNLSARLTGQSERLGNIKDLTRLADLELTYLDTGAFAEGAGHFTVATSPLLIQLLARIDSLNTALAAERAGRTGLLPGVVLSVRNVTGIILSPVSGIATELEN
jgi:esterase/lipase superfamily enzyme